MRQRTKNCAAADNGRGLNRSIRAIIAAAIKQSPGFRVTSRAFLFLVSLEVRHKWRSHCFPLAINLFRATEIFSYAEIIKVVKRGNLILREHRNTRNAFTVASPRPNGVSRSSKCKSHGTNKSHAFHVDFILLL